MIIKKSYFTSSHFLTLQPTPWRYTSDQTGELFCILLAAKNRSSYLCYSPTNVDVLFLLESTSYLFARGNVATKDTVIFPYCGSTKYLLLIFHKSKTFLLSPVVGLLLPPFASSTSFLTSLPTYYIF